MVIKPYVDLAEEVVSSEPIEVPDHDAECSRLEFALGHVILNTYHDWIRGEILVT